MARSSAGLSCAGEPGSSRIVFDRPPSGQKMARPAGCLDLRLVKVRNSFPVSTVWSWRKDLSPQFFPSEDHLVRKFAERLLYASRLLRSKLLRDTYLHCRS